jgi:hypothetical protein
MHIFKSRNPIWLIGDILMTIWMWKAGVLVAAIFFTFDSIIQFLYTILPDMVDAWDKNTKYRVFYTLFLVVGIFFLIRYLTATKVI